MVPPKVGELSKFSDDLFLSCMMLKPTRSTLHETHLQEVVARTHITDPRCLRRFSISAQESTIPALLSTLSPALPLHFTSLFSLSQFLIQQTSLPLLLSALSFTFLPSVAVSFCIRIVLCKEKAKRATETASFVH